MTLKEITHNLSKVRLTYFLKNLSNSTYYDMNRKIKEHEKEIKFLRFMNYFNFNKDGKYLEELQYINEIGALESFPYKQIKTIENLELGFDSKFKLPYVMHKDKKLFFPKSYSLEFIKATYKYYVETENILGGGYREKTPHQYITDKFKVCENDILLDIGSAEALFALEHVDVAKKIFVFENDSKWFDALHATFSPYQDKVTIVKKLVSDFNSNDTITLDSCLKDFAHAPVFIKMDIEGMELKVLSDNAQFLKKHTNIKVACTTYHHDFDANELEDFFTKTGFEVEFSDGYLLFLEGEFKPPYFRKGLIRATKSEN